MMIGLAPLRERDDDALLLAKHFMQLTEKRYGLSKHTFSASAMDALRLYSWPGNVRELRHQVSRAVLLSISAQISATDLALRESKSEPTTHHFQTQITPITLDDSEKNLLINALEANHQNDHALSHG
jgi:two-component system response regulator AtoC